MLDLLGIDSISISVFDFERTVDGFEERCLSLFSALFSTLFSTFSGKDRRKGESRFVGSLNFGVMIGVCICAFFTCILSH